MKVLFIGGTGNISTASVELAVARGYDVTVFNRGQRASLIDGDVRTIAGDRDNPDDLRRVAAAGPYDVVANFVGYRPEQVAKDIEAFSGKIGQYVFISSASVYQKPANHYVITEATPLANPRWQYSRDKLACENLLMQAYRDSAFPTTIVRPSYTYGVSWIPSALGGQDYTVVDRMRRGLPIVVHGDGQSLWVNTCNEDFAVGFVGLFGNPRAMGEAFHITSDEALTWDNIYLDMARAAGCEAKLVHISSEMIVALYPEQEGNLLGDKAISSVFDNSKIKRVVPEFRCKYTFLQGMRRSIAWYDANPSRRKINPAANAMLDRLIRMAEQAVANAQ
jgi:nucleoside-diphosphate-sugar epimerase